MLQHIGHCRSASILLVAVVDEEGTSLGFLRSIVGMVCQNSLRLFVFAIGVVGSADEGTDKYYFM